MQSSVAIGQNYPDFKEKKTRIFTDLGIGTSSIPGYLLHTDIQVNRNKHNFSVNALFSSQIRNNFDLYSSSNGFDAYNIPDIYYNDHYSHLGIFYGRSFSYKRFHSSINGGIAYYNYLDQQLDKKLINNQIQYSFIEKRSEGMAYSMFGDISLFIGQNFAISGIIFFDLNKSKNIIGLSGNLKYFFKE